MIVKPLIAKACKEIGYSLGSYNNRLEILAEDEYALEDVIEAIKFELLGDVLVTINGKQYVVELMYVDNEIEIDIKTRQEYKKVYDLDCYDEDDI